jgi:hypothetical protein
LRETTWRRGPRRPRGRLTGCLLWVIGLIVILVILALLFGGFQKGTKVGADARAALSRAAASLALSRAAASLALPRAAALPRFAPQLGASQPAHHARRDGNITIG